MQKFNNEEELKREELIFKINVCKNSYRYEEMLTHLEILIKSFGTLKKKERSFLEIPIKGIIQRYQTKLRKLEELTVVKKKLITILKNDMSKSEELDLTVNLLDFITNQMTMYKTEKKQFCDKSL